MKSQTIRRLYKCTACGHEQWVAEVVTSHGLFAGSGQNWCDKCLDGKPEPTEQTRADNASPAEER